ncbi:MAG: nucleotidyltransferase family protein [Candidatus Nanohaloarchaea archaeon]
MELDKHTHREAFESLASELTEYPSVEKVKLFGSVARGEHGVNSDVDILVEISDHSDTEKIEEKAFQKSSEFGVSITPIIVEKGEKTPVTEKAEKEGIEYVPG